MGSRRMKWAMAGMIVVFLVVFAVIAIVNLDTVKQKLGLAEREPVQEEMTAQEEAVETEDGQIGGDLSAFLRDETFFDPEVKFKSIESYSGRSVSLMMSSVAKDLRISVITTMKAYEQLEAEGLVTAAQGKGFYVNAQDSEMLKEQHLRRVEEALAEAIRAARIAGMTGKELQEILRTLLDMQDEKES